MNHESSQTFWYGRENIVGQTRSWKPSCRSSFPIIFSIFKVLQGFFEITYFKARLHSPSQTLYQGGSLYDNWWKSHLVYKQSRVCNRWVKGSDDPYDSIIVPCEFRVSDKSLNSMVMPNGNTTIGTLCQHFVHEE